MDQCLAVHAEVAALLAFCDEPFGIADVVEYAVEDRDAVGARAARTQLVIQDSIGARPE